MSTRQEADTETAAASPTVPVSPPRPRRQKKRRLPHLDHCLNCDRPTGPDENFCPNCGQKNEDETVALKPLVTDFLSEMASWDSKLFRTVVPLLIRPGFLTNEYLAGRRVRYLSPLKMYLVISAIFFLVLPLTFRAQNTPVTASVSPSAAPAGPGHSTVNSRSRNSDMSLSESGNPILDRLPPTVAAYDAQQRDPHYAHHDAFWKALLFRQIIKAKQDKQTFDQSLIQSLIGNLPKMMFVLLPLFALQLKVTYPSRFYIEHVTFALHTHAFLFTLLTVARLAIKAGAAPGFVGTAFALIMPVYLLAAQRHVYREDWPRTVVKFLWLGFSYVFLLTIALILTGIAAFLLA